MPKELQHFPIEEFQKQLLDWFEQNMRDLPWRKDKDPYKIWVSEIMLQQTRVETVIPYFNRFMEKFPTVEALANASEDEVLKQWEGLGYYSRARNLLTAVREVQLRYGGDIPEDPKQMLDLKGVGPYTAGAILSIAYGQREPAVDGNVMRVMSRIFAIKEDIQKSKTRVMFEQLVRELIPTGSASYFNQGIMELGALICIPKSPQCVSCPVQAMCKGRELRIQDSLPIKQKKKKPRSVHMTAGLLVHNGHVLICQRGNKGLLAKLFEFPNVEWHERSAEETISQHIFEKFQLRAETREQLQSVRHIFTHLIWNISVFRLTLVDHKEVSSSLPANSDWVRLEDLEQYTFSVSHQKIKNQLMQLSKKESLYE